jgi:putative ABC transport system substrate-binding protein
MRRREFIRLFSSTIVAWPLTARAQQAAVPVIGFLNSGSSKALQSFVAAFRQGLSESGYVEGQNLAIEYRWADGDYEKLPRLAVDLVDRHVSAIIAGGPPAIMAAEAATTTIPIVFTSGGNPIELGFVSSLSKPGGNVTGVSFLLNELGAKRSELLRELVPAATSVGFLANPTRPSFQSEVTNTQQAAPALGVKLVVLNASTEAEIDAAFAEFSRQGIAALSLDSFFQTRRDQIVALANRFRIATMYNLREYVVAGGLISYAPSLAEVYRQAGVYVAKIVKGAKPAHLPVLQPTKFRPCDQSQDSQGTRSHCIQSDAIARRRGDRMR